MGIIVTGVVTMLCLIIATPIALDLKEKHPKIEAVGYLCFLGFLCVPLALLLHFLVYHLAGAGLVNVLRIGWQWESTSTYWIVLYGLIGIHLLLTFVLEMINLISSTLDKGEKSRVYSFCEGALYLLINPYGCLLSCIFEPVT